MAEEGQSIGTARIDIVIDLDSYKAEIDRAKTLASGLGTDFEASFQKMTGSAKSATSQALLLSQTWGKNADEIKLLTLAARGAAPEALDALRTRMAAVRAETLKGGSQLDIYGLSATKTAAALKGLAAISLLGVGASFTGLITHSIDLGENLDKAALKASITGTAMSELAYAAKLSDVDLDSLSAALRIMQDSLSKAGAGAQVPIDALKALGLTIGDLKGQSADKQLEIIADRINNLRDASDKARAATDLFGRGGASLLPLFSQGADGIRKAREEAEKLGESFSDEQLQKLSGADEAIKKLKASSEGFATAITADLAPALTTLLTKMTNLTSGATYEKFVKFLSGGGGVASALSVELALLDKVASGTSKDRSLPHGIITRPGESAPPGGPPGFGPTTTAQALQKMERDQRDADARSKALFASHLTDVKLGLDAELDAYQQQGDLLEARHAAGLVSDSTYYAAKRRLLDADVAAQVKALDDQNRLLDQGTADAKAAAADATAAANKLLGKDPAAYQKAIELAGQKTSEAQQIQLQNDEQHTENLAKQANLTANLAGQTAVLNVQQQAGIDALTKSYRQAQDAAENYIQTVAQGYQRTLADQFAGDQQKQFDSGRQALEDKYAQQLQQAQIDQENNPNVDAAVYDRRRALIQSSLTQELSLYQDYWAKLLAGETDWINGASSAINNYRDDARNVAAQTATLFTDAFKGSEDALVHFAETGKLSFKNLATSIIDDLARIESKAAISKILGLFNIPTAADTTFTDGTLWSNVTHNAAGNVFVSRGLSTYSDSIVSNPTLFPFARGAGLMGEAGPEAILPLKRTAGGKLGVVSNGGGSLQVEINNYGGGTVTAKQQITKAPDGTVMKKLMIDVLADDIASGGKAASALKQRFGLREVR